MSLLGLITKNINDNAEILGEIHLGNVHRRIYREFLTADENDAMKLELIAFRNSVLNGIPPVVSGEDGLKALKLAEEIVSIISSIQNL